MTANCPIWSVSLTGLALQAASLSWCSECRPSLCIRPGNSRMARVKRMAACASAAEWPSCAAVTETSSSTYLIKAERCGRDTTCDANWSESGWLRRLPVVASRPLLLVDAM
jgi:hypothetical protein